MRRSLLGLLALSCAPAPRGDAVGSSSQAVTFGAELAADPAIALGTDASEGATAAAYDGSQYLVVWTEGSRIYGARVTSAGSVLDPVGFPIASGVADARPAVAWGAGTFLVTWESSAAVFASRVSPQGTVTDATPLQVASGVAPDVAFDGTRFVVGWLLESFPWWHRVQAARVSPGGSLLDATPITLVNGSGVRHNLRLAHGAATTLLCWDDERNSTLGDIFCARLADDGSVLDAEGFDLTLGFGSNADRAPAVAHDGVNWLIVWQRGTGTNSAIAATRLAANATKLETLSPLYVGNAVGAQQRPAVSFDGTHYFVIWADSRSGTADIYATRVLPDATIVDTAAGFPISSAPGAQTIPALAAGNAGALVAWIDARNDLGGANHADVFAARVAGDGTLLDGPAASGGLPLSYVANAQHSSRAAWSGAAWLVVWEDERDPASMEDLWGAGFKRMR